MHAEGCGVWLHHQVMLASELFDAANESIEEKNNNVASTLTLVDMVVFRFIFSDLDLEALKGHI
jgi:hypothetical protein